MCPTGGPNRLPSVLFDFGEAFPAGRFDVLGDELRSRTWVILVKG
jgi:hypothetical protein